MARFPPVLYKYCKPDGVDILEHLRLEVTPPMYFNDPLEFAPRMRPEFSIEDARKYVSRREFRRLQYQTFLQAGFVGSFEQFEIFFLGKVREDLAKKVVEDYPKDAEQFRDEQVEFVSREIGLICLSAVPDDILMWAHYTDSHKGFVVGFDTSDEFFANPVVHEVRYLSKRVLMGHWGDMRDAKRRATQVNSLIRRKSPHWKYEKEWRQARAFVNCQPSQHPSDKNRTLYHASISAKAITEVIKGLRCTDGRVEELLKQPHFSETQLRKVVLHESEFKLGIIDA